ncbi:MAG: hypothetical protein RL077_2289 [Verrucomicrobiota bacterium]|jgi:SAM-dependent methyltransferase
MAVKIIHPASRAELDENAPEKINGVYRMTEGGNYTGNFGYQWNKFTETQIDSKSNLDLSLQRFFAETNWTAAHLEGAAVLEVGSGAGRFTQVVLEHTPATLYSVDYSNAVEANFRNNGHHGERLKLFQASIYELPFAPDSFDKVFCFGVLQHTPDFEASIAALVQQAKPGGEIVVDFYPIKGWWTKLNAKYLLRPFTKRMRHDRLLRLIERNVDWLISAHFLMHRIGLGVLTRFLPVCNVKDSFPKSLSREKLREWTILDTFDQYSPEHDHPQRIADVAMMFERQGGAVTFAGFVPYGTGMSAAVVRAVRR